MLTQKLWYLWLVSANADFHRCCQNNKQSNIRFFVLLKTGMNVIMPTAMSSIHQDPELKECAAKTANEGTKILRLLKGNGDVVGNCKAILDVCEGSGTVEGSKDLIEVRLNTRSIILLLILIFSLIILFGPFFRSIVSITQPIVLGEVLH